MSAESLEVASIDIPAGERTVGGSDSLLTVSPSILVLTWLAFGILAVLLSKLAWKPIMAALEAREESARRMAQDAERIARQKREWEESREKRMIEAQRAAEDIIAKAREAALTAGAEIERVARQNAEKMLDEARKDIEQAAVEAKAQLLKEAAAVASKLASACLAERMDAEMNEEIARAMIKDISR